MPLKLSDSEMSLLIALSAPIDPNLRPEFLRLGQRSKRANVC
jgi:hypothetical protein